jgi:hypothetical protein
VDTVPYAGWGRNLRLANGDSELIITLDVGPRVLSYRLAGGPNAFHEFAGQLGRAGEPDWQVRGGHRLWLAPEDLTRTYAPDNGPVSFTPLGPRSVRVTQPPDQPYGVRKEIDVTLADAGSDVTLLHRITNVGKEPAEFAPWTLTVVPPGGVAIIPLPPKRPHPGPPSNARAPSDFWPNQRLILWPFTDLSDPRYTFASRHILLRQDPTRGPTKIGLAHRLGAVGYFRDGLLFVKRFGYREGRTYPDEGSSFETFTNEHCLELEALGPMARVAPGESVEFAESWDLHAGVAWPGDAAGIDRIRERFLNS